MVAFAKIFSLFHVIQLNDFGVDYVQYLYGLYLLISILKKYVYICKIIQVQRY